MGGLLAHPQACLGLNQAGCRGTVPTNQRLDLKLSATLRIAFWFRTQAEPWLVLRWLCRRRPCWSTMDLIWCMAHPKSSELRINTQSWGSKGKLRGRSTDRSFLFPRNRLREFLLAMGMSVTNGGSMSMMWRSIKNVNEGWLPEELAWPGSGRLLCSATAGSFEVQSAAGSAMLSLLAMSSRSLALSAGKLSNTRICPP